MPVAIAATVVANGRQIAPTIAICDPEDERVTSNSQGKRRSGDDHLAAVAATTTTTATTTIGGGEWRNAAWSCPQDTAKTRQRIWLLRAQIACDFFSRRRGQRAHTFVATKTLDELSSEEQRGNEKKSSADSHLSSSSSGRQRSSKTVQTVAAAAFC